MFDEYQKQASKTFKTHGPLTAEQSRLLNWAIGLSGETGEVEELVKHFIWGHEELDKMALAKELGDVLWYLAAICTTTDMDLSAVAELNAAKLTHRYDNAGYSADASVVRHQSEKAFQDTFMYQNLRAKILRTKAPLNVIFVGPDGSGKTSIAKKVAELLADEGFVYHKCDYRQEDKPYLAKELLESQVKVIYDRFYYPDDIIYSRVKHEKESAEPMDWDCEYWKAYNEVVDTLDQYNTLYIYTVADKPTLIERSTAWKDDYIATEDLDKIITLYERWRGFIKGRPQLCYTLDTTSKILDKCVEEAIEVIRRAQAAFSNMPTNTYLDKKEDDSDGTP